MYVQSQKSAALLQICYVYLLYTYAVKYVLASCKLV